MSTINIKQLKKSYAQTQVIHGIDIDINDGEFVVLVGPSGCGKSTLLRMVAGLETITDGTVTIDDVVVNQLEPKDRGISMVFQNYALYPHMSVFDNMAYGLKLMKLPKDEINQRVNEAADLLQISEYLQRKPSNLSGGQRQRVAMGRAIVRKPKVFLFDEPLSNLDAKLRVQMRMQIKTLQQKLGVTCIYVTHDQVEAMTMADKLVVLNQGQAAQIGSPMELYDHPKNQFVAGFIGSPAMNFIPCSISDAAIVIGDNTIPRPEQITHRGNFTLGVRPEHFIEASETGNNYCISGLIELVEKLGANILVYLRCKNIDELIVIQREGHINAQLGQHLTIALDPTKLYFFDPKSKERLL